MPPSEDDVFPRPSTRDIQSAWTRLFSDPLISLSRLRQHALSKDGLGHAAQDGGVLLRSVYWRSYHSLLPPLTSLDLYPQSLNASRTSYNNLRARFLIAPDGRWADDCTGAETLQSTRARSTSSSSGPSATTYDPLSLDEQSPWKAWYAQLELRTVIRQDVDRTFPDIEYFTLERVRRSLVTSLFLFAMLNPDVGYRQGMHELFAVCLMTVDRDSLINPNPAGSGSKSPTSPRPDRLIEEAMDVTLDRRYVEHDAFELFSAIMKAGKAFYEWRQDEGSRSRVPGETVLQAPIVVRCGRLQSSLIRRIDPQLHDKLESEGVEAQLWAMRWYKLIFTRELPFPLALRLWDGIFAEDPTLGILDFICVAMLLLIRNELLDSDHGGLLTSLLRYPPPSPEYPFSPFLILSQALLLRNSITPTTGVEVVIQNHEVLGVAARPPSAQPLSPPPRDSPISKGQGRVQGIAAGLFERAQAAGLDRAIMSTVNDLKRNLPETYSSYLPNPFSPLHAQAARDPSGSFSSIPSSPSIFPRQHPTNTTNPSTPTHPPLSANPSFVNSTDAVPTKALRDAERQLAELRLAMLGMGKAMSEWMDGITPSAIGAEERKGLERIRETLLYAPSSSVDDIVKEWGWHDRLEAQSSRATTPGPEDPSPVESEEKGGQDKEDEDTPMPPSVPVVPPPPQIQSVRPEAESRPEPKKPQAAQAPRPRSQPQPQPQTQATKQDTSSKPSLHLSSRDGKPSAGLTRTPGLSAPSWTSSALPSPQPSLQTGTEAKVVENGDPLAELGARSSGSARSASVKRRGGGASTGGGATSGKGVDPLMGLGLS